jgi:hypothetical protein
VASRELDAARDVDGLCAVSDALRMQIREFGVVEKAVNVV